MLYVDNPQIGVRGGLRGGFVNYGVLSVNGERYIHPAGAAVQNTIFDFVEFSANFIANRQALIIVTLGSGAPTFPRSYPGPILAKSTLYVDGAFREELQTLINVRSGAGNVMIAFGYVAATDGEHVIKVYCTALKHAYRYQNSPYAWVVENYPYTTMKINMSVVVYP